MTEPLNDTSTERSAQEAMKFILWLKITLEILLPSIIQKRHMDSFIQIKTNLHML